MTRLDAYEFVVHPRIVGRGPTVFAGLSRHVDLKLVSRLEYGSGAVAMRYEPQQATMHSTRSRFVTMRVRRPATRSPAFRDSLVCWRENAK